MTYFPSYSWDTLLKMSHHQGGVGGVVYTVQPRKFIFRALEVNLNKKRSL